MRLPSLRSTLVAKVLMKIGFEKMRQTGSHLILLNRETKKIVTIPIHSGDIKRGLLFGIIKQSGLSAKEFMKFL